MEKRLEVAKIACYFSFQIIPIGSYFDENLRFVISFLSNGCLSELKNCLII